MRLTDTRRVSSGKLAAAGFLAIAAFLTLGSGKAGAAEADAAGLLEKTGIRGGLCLVIGAKDTALAKELAAKSALYVQTLQPDAKLAAAWGAEFARQDCQDREKLGVRNAVFDPAHYGSDLFNLILVEDAAALGPSTSLRAGNAKLADLYRVLVPNGCVAFKRAPEGFGAEAKTLRMDTLQAGPFQAVFRKPVPPVEWKPAPLAIRWIAGPRSQDGSYGGLVSGSGKFFYWEKMEVEGERWKEGRYQLFARDEFNGRVLWTREEPVGWNPWGWSARTNMAADNHGRLFTATGDGKLVCLDADTGKQRFVLMDKGAGGVIELCDNDKYVLACGKVFSAEDGKLLWTLPPPAGWAGKIKEFVQLPKVQKWPAQYYVDGDSIFFCDGKTLKIGKLADGKMQQFALEVIPNPELYGGLVLSGRHVLVCTGRNISSVDRTSGKLLWSYLWPVPDKDVGNAMALPYGDRLVIFRRRHNIDLTQLNLVTGKVELEKTVPIGPNEAVSGCAPCRFDLGDYVIDKERWVNKKTLEGTKVSSPGGGNLPTGLPCTIGATLSKDAELFFSVPGRKSSNVLAFGPVDITAPSTNEPGWRRFQRSAQPTSSEPTGTGDWPMFRGSFAMGNSSKTTPGDKPVKAWETTLGLGGRSLGVMSGERTGLTQPVVAYGLAIVSDIEGQRVVAVNVADGKTRWAFHVGSRVDFSPTLYNGLCLFMAKDGWVYCLDAKTGALVWKNLVPAVERYIGGHEKLESMWPPNLNVAVADGLGYILRPFGFHKDRGGEPIQMVFKPETAELATAPANAPAGRRLTSPYGGLQYIVEIGNSLARLFAEKAYPKMQDGRASGKLVAFDDALSLEYTFVNTVVEGDWRNVAKAWPCLKAMKDNPKVPLWEIAPSELVVDDIVMTPARIYCVGHYQRVAKPPELWVVSREDGKVVNTVPVEGFPAFMGMSASGNRLFVATREGKLICYQGGK